MSIVQHDDLLHYIKSAIEIETDKATQKQIISEYAAYSEQKKPKIVTQAEPEKPVWHFENREENATMLLVTGIFTVLFCVSFGFVCLAFDMPGFGIFLLLCCIPALLLFNPFIKERSRYKEEAKLYSEICKNIDVQRDKIRKQNQNSEDAYHKNIGVWRTATQEMNAALNARLAKTNSLSDRFYASDVIYPKYRNLPALTSIYEYLITGRCEGLTGPHGAYNLYEDEMRKDTVISQLNTVIENLEQIKNNQYMLYQQVKEIRQNTDTIISELQQIGTYTVQIAQLTALNTYYAAMNERNTRITMYYHL